MKLHARLGAVLASVLILASGARSFAQDLEIVPGPDGTISVRAVEVPLEALLNALRVVGPDGKLVLRNGVGERRVTLTVEGTTALRAAVAALEAAGVDYVLGEKRLVALDAGFRGAPAPALATAPAQPVDAPDLDVTRRAERKESDAADSEHASAETLERIEREAPGRIATLEGALSAPSWRVASPGTWVPLPFPASENGSAVGAVKPTGPSAHVLPFPASGAAPAPRATVPITDPRVLKLMHDLSAKPQSPR